MKKIKERIRKIYKNYKNNDNSNNNNRNVNNDNNNNNNNDNNINNNNNNNDMQEHIYFDKKIDNDNFSFFFPSYINLFISNLKDLLTV